MKKKHQLILRHRAKVDEDIYQLHDSFLQKQSGVLEKWRIPENISISLPDIAGKLGVEISLKGVLHKDLKGKIAYCFRGANYIQDDAQFDDLYAIEFDFEKVNMAELIKVVPDLIVAFDAYRAEVCDPYVPLNYWDDIQEKCERTGKDVDGRDGIYRFYAVNFMDRELCRRAFNLVPEQVAERIEGKVKLVQLIHDGVYTVFSDQYLGFDEIEKLNAEVMRLLIHQA